MDEKTYADLAVAKILNQNFICVKVDQDSRPDLSNRYEEYGWPATIETLQLARSLAPAGSLWTAFGIGRHSFPMVALSTLAGGHGRVGLEDNLFIERGVLAPGNGALCAKAARIVRHLGCELATPQEARALLGLGDSR